MFRKDDYIKLKEGTKLETGEEIIDWAGQIHEVYLKEKCCLIIIDAQTINSLSDEYLIDSIQEGAEPFEYVFEFKDIELTTRRDTDDLVMKALDNLSERVLKLEETLEKNIELIVEQFKEQWTDEFPQNQQFKKLSEYQKENASFIIGTFMDLIYNYEYIEPKDWKPANIKSVCLDIVPRKITSEQELFENYGEVLEHFFKFLGSKQYINNSEELETTVRQIKTRIPKEANNSNNWGIAKSMMMEAQNSGIDFNNEEELQSYLMEQNLNRLNNQESAKVIPLRPNPFKGIGRNQKITVKYKDGNLIENIKFKKVEQDLRDGKCDFLKE